MPVVINDFEVVTEPEAPATTAGQRTPADHAEPPEWEAARIRQREREERLRAH